MSTPLDHDREAEAASSRERVMGFWDHLNELRGTIIKSIVVFLLFAGLIAYYLNQFNQLLMWPFHRAMAMHPDLALGLATATPMEGINVLIQLCMLGALMLAAPFVLFFVGQFVAPALTERETKAVLPLCVASLLLFVGGAAFGFFVLMPSAMHVFVEVNLSMGWDFRWTVGSYYAVLTRLVLGVGATFQFPLIIVLLVWLGLVNTTFLRKYRRHAIVLVFVIATLVTPTTDPLNQVLVAAPLYVLYELAVVIAARVERRRERSAAAVVLAVFVLLPRRREISPKLAQA